MTDLYVVKGNNGQYVKWFSASQMKVELTYRREEAHEFQFGGVAQQVCDRVNMLQAWDGPKFMVRHITGC